MFGWGRPAKLERLLSLAIVLVAGMTVWALASSAPIALPIVGVAALALLAVSVLRLPANPDHVRARQSDRTLHIANETLSYLRAGLSRESAQAVCRLILPATQAVAVAITDNDRILGFAGSGEDHHAPGGPIITRGTRETLADGTPRTLANRSEIGCPEPSCPLHAAIVVPLKVRGVTIGTLKFYYGTPRFIDETQLAMAEGLANLLSTQLGIAELDHQTELATRAELKALQAQINPHFLFNTINTIAALIRTDPAQARILLREFAFFYRRMLEHSQDLIHLGQEIEQTLRYLGFEIARFGDRISVETDIGRELEDILVPAFVIQPLVENSVNHGMSDERPLHVVLRAQKTDDGVVLQVIDDGVGIPSSELPYVMDAGYGTGLGIALKNVEDRIHGHFGLASSMRIESTEGEGTTVTLTLDGRSISIQEVQ